VIAEDIIDQSSGEILANANDEITESLLAKLSNLGSNRCIPCISTTSIAVASFRRLCAPTKRISRQAARIAIYRMMRPGEPPTEEAVEILFNGLFYSDDRYDLSGVGRMKFNRRVARKDVIEYKVMVKHVPSKRDAIIKLINDQVGDSVANVEQMIGELSHGPRAVAENLTQEAAVPCSSS
jgi:DNA-directed RNA polymerase subunit beta